MTGITFLVGGVRSGKSSLAVEMGRRHDGPVVFVATAVPFDGETQRRVNRHRAERPSWPVIEAPVDLTSAISSIENDALLIVDCLTVWVGNLGQDGGTPDDVFARTAKVVEALSVRSAPAVVVSNEVGMGVHPSTAVGRAYRDVLGTVNQIVARAAERTLLLVAGRALELVDPWDALR